MDPAGAERRLPRLDRLYRALNATLEAIMRARSPDELYQSVCDASVNGAEFLAATVFLRDPGGPWLRPAAGTGPIAGKVQGLSLSIDGALPAGQGIVSTACRTRARCVTNDAQADPRMKHWWEVLREVGVNATAAWPLLRGGRSVGVLAYYASATNEFDEEMVGLLERLSANMSFALENFELQAATQRAGRMYAALSATNEAILRTSTPQALFDRVCQAGVDGGKFSLAAVLLPQGRGTCLEVAAAAGREQGVRQLREAIILSDEARPEGRGLVGTAFRSGEPQVSGDYQQDERTRPWRVVPAQAVDAGSCAAVPLIQDGRSVGVLLFLAQEKAAFDAGIVILLERLGDNVCFALDNIRREDERKAAQQHIQYLATHDVLTGLPNRMMFIELLDRALQSARRYQRRFAVMFIDLDGFKRVNDTLGHAAGDELLQELGTRFKRELRDSDVVARLGGDEFIVLLQEAGMLEQVSAVADKLVAAASRPLTLADWSCRVSASVGVAIYPDSAADEHALMRHADAAMYQAKQAGKNQVRFYGTVPGPATSTFTTPSTTSSAS